MGFLRNELDFPGLLKYAAWRLLASQGKVRIRLVSGFRLELRPQPYSDLFDDTEISVRNVYRCPCPELPSVKTVLARTSVFHASAGHVFSWHSTTPPE
jgi:hypothetical protein